MHSYEQKHSLVNKYHFRLEDITQIFMTSDTITSYSNIWKLQLVTTIQHYCPLPSYDKQVILKHALVYLDNFDKNIYSYSSLYT